MALTPSTAPRLGYGASVSFSGTAIAFVTSIKPCELEVPKVRATLLSSVNTEGQPHEVYLPGAVNYSSIEVESQYDEATYDALIGYAAARMIASLVITAEASGETWTAQAWISKGPGADFKAANEVSAMKLTFDLTTGFVYGGTSSVSG